MAKSSPTTISAESLAALMERAWRDASGNGPRIPGIKVRQYVRDNADTVKSLAPFSERPAYGGNRVHVYSVPDQTDPIVRAIAARIGVRAGRTMPLSGALAPYVKAARTTARPSNGGNAAARKRPQGGSVPPQTMAPLPDTQS